MIPKAVGGDVISFLGMEKLGTNTGISGSEGTGFRKQKQKLLVKLGYCKDGVSPAFALCSKRLLSTG